MKWVLRTLAFFVFVLVLAFAVGVLVPKDHVASVRAVYAAEKEVIWDTVSNLETWPSWHAEIDGMERLPDREGKPHWVMRSAWGEMPQVVEEQAPSQKLVTVIPADAGIGYSGSWTWQIEETSDGTALTITERGRVTNPFFRFVSRFVMGYHGSMRTFHEELSGKLGQKVETEDL